MDECLTFMKNFFITLIFVCLIGSGLAQAHEIRPSIVDFNGLENNQFELSIKTNAEALLAGIGSEHDNTDQASNAEIYNQFRTLDPISLEKKFEEFKAEFLQSLSLKFDDANFPFEDAKISIPEVGDLDLARDSIITVIGEIPGGAKTLQWSWPEKYGTSVIRINAFGEDVGKGYSAFLSAGTASENIEFTASRAQTAWEVFVNYIQVGFVHIVPKGLDHILFVVGLFLLSSKLSALLWQISAFTVAHTVTLALGALGIVSISPAIVEPLIAASIVYVAVENIFTDHLQKWRPFVVFCFGLLHGLGFAGVLGEIGLSTNHFFLGLISFNVGVELGQLFVVSLCFLFVGLWFRNKSWYRQRITVPASLGIAVVASWWVFERIFLT